MSVRSLFDVILKVLGIFFIRDILEAFSRSLSVLVYFPQYSSEKEAFFNLGVTIPPLVLYTLFCWLLIFRTQNLMRFLRIEKNVGEEPVSLDIQRSTVLTVAVVLTGGLLLVNEIPEFFRLAVYYYQERILYDRMVRPDFSYPVMSLIKILIGLALIIWHTPFVHLIEAISKNRVQLNVPDKRSNKGKRATEVNSER